MFMKFNPRQSLLRWRLLVLLLLKYRARKYLVKKIKATVSATLHIHGCSIEISESASAAFLRNLLGAIVYVK
jgi:hypothetical protein